MARVGWTGIAAGVLVAAGCVDLGPVEGPFDVTSNVDDWRDEVIYQLMVDRFADGDVSNNYNWEPNAPGRFHGGDWQGIIDRLDYLEELGITAIWISPVVKNLEEDAGFSSYHGYWQQDLTDVNPHFGDIAKLRELVQACHDRGIKVVLDIVTNHIAQLFFYDINGNGRPDDTTYGSGTRSEVAHVTEYDPDYDARGIQGFTSLGENGPAPIRWIYDPAINRVPPIPEELQNPDWYNRRGRVIDWNQFDQVVYGDFPGGLKDIRTELPEVQELLTRAFGDWIELADFDGFRIDTLKHVEHEFWQYFAPGIRARAKALGKERFLMFGESFDGNDELNGSFTVPGELDSVFYFSQKFRVFDDVFRRGYATAAIERLFTERADNYSDVPQEDGAGVAPRSLLVNFLDNHDVPRFLYEATAEELGAALGFLFTWDGIPCLYYGTEQGYSGGNDPANREDLWLSGYDTTGSIFQYIRTLIALRQQYAPLRRGEVQIRWSTERTSGQDAGIFAFERTYEDETVLVVVNAGSSSSETSASSTGGGPMITSFPPGTTLTNVLPDEDEEDSFTVAASGAVTVRVPAHGIKILTRGQAPGS